MLNLYPYRADPAMRFVGYGRLAQNAIYEIERDKKESAERYKVIVG